MSHTVQGIAPVELHSASSLKQETNQTLNWQKRLMDICLAACLILAFMPVMFIIAILIVMEDGGKIIFTQARYGKNRKVFTIYKFRTMTQCASKAPFHQASNHDARVTPIGSFLRRTSLDELPQLFNVLKGDMSLVGPRPHAIEHDNQYYCKLADYERRHNVLPGMTGLAQIKGLRGPTETDSVMQKRLALDIKYIQTMSFWSDIIILAKTPLALFSGRNAF